VSTPPAISAALFLEVLCGAAAIGSPGAARLHALPWRNRRITSVAIAVKERLFQGRLNDQDLRALAPVNHAS